MFSPKLLVNLSLVLAIMSAVLFSMVVLLTPYTGFELSLDKENDQFVVTRVDESVAAQGLNIGDRVLSLASTEADQILLTPIHYPKTSIEARQRTRTKADQLRAMAEVYEILATRNVTLGLARGEDITLQLDQRRPIGSVPFEVWVCIFLTSMCSLLPALAWSWRPTSRETVYLLLSGFGLSLATISAGLLYTMEMHYLPLWGYWLVFELVGFGNFIFVGFATVLLLYFPQKLFHADRWNNFILGGLASFTLIALFDGWDFDVPVSEQFLTFGYLEVYLVELVLYMAVLFLCFIQWRLSKNLPVERAQALWITLAWTLCPIVFFVFYLLPVLLGQEAILSRTWTTTALLIAFAMVIVGVSRFRFFRLENHIGSAYQWSLVSLFFFSLDIILISVVNLSPTTSTFILLGLILWVYLPIRQWLFSRVSRDRQHRYQRLFNSAVISMIEDSLIPTKSVVGSHEAAWKKTLDVVFSPGEVNRGDSDASTRVEKRGQQLLVAGHRFSPPLSLEFAEHGARIFGSDDVNLAETLSLLFVRLYDFRDGYAAGQIRERERIRRDLHDQIGHKLLSLVYAAQDSKSLQLAQDTMEQIRELSRALKEEPVALQNFIIELRQICEDTCEQTGLSLHWHDTSVDEGQFITSNQYLNVLNITRELFSNTAKHARASKTTVSVETNNKSMVLTVTDNGIGFDQTAVNPGNGLFNIQSRAEEMGAKIQWHTAAGTNVVIQIPLQTDKEIEVA